MTGYIPQILQGFRTRSTKDMNKGFIVMVFIGILLYEVYAISLVMNDTGGAYLATNTFSLISSGILVYQKLKYR